MKRFEIYGNTANVGCGDCKHWSSLLDAEFGRVECATCKRIDGQTIKFYRPTFACAPPSSNFICRDFEPVSYNKCLIKYWKGFDDYFRNYIEHWDVTLKARMDKGVAYKALTVLNDTKKTYHMKLQDFIEGNIWQADGKLNVCKVAYYKKGRVVYDSVDGLEISELKNRAEVISANEISQKFFQKIFDKINLKC